jgi:hypothetical protein
MGLPRKLRYRCTSSILDSPRICPIFIPVRLGILQRLRHLLGNHNDTQPFKQSQHHHTRRWERPLQTPRLGNPVYIARRYECEWRVPAFVLGGPNS